MFRFGNNQINYFGIKLADNLILALAVVFIETVVETALKIILIFNFNFMIKHKNNFKYDNLMYLIVEIFQFNFIFNSLFLNEIQNKYIFYIFRVKLTKRFKQMGQNKVNTLYLLKWSKKFAPKKRSIHRFFESFYAII